ncbi:MAG: lysoplasmalogenase [Bacteroidetes bacterium]|nr:lysoplasmalogenase [Bacteroidota bacterium]
MRKQPWVYLFLVVLLIHLAAIYFDNTPIEKITKPLLIILLAGYFIVSTRRVNSSLRKSVLLALFFSWAGDVLLMFVSDNSNFFLAGLVSFLIAHIFYIIFFHSVRVQQDVKPKAFLLIPVLVYYVALITFLSPHLGDMKLPVRIYGVVICFMLMLALHMLYIKSKNTGFLMLIGALLFVISDSVLAINKFYITFNGAGIIIMLTYSVAQLLITKGAIDYISSEIEKQKSGT